jgi:thiazole tautomerase (transcriptional regulator TenI)
LDPPILHVLSNGTLSMKAVVEKFKRIEPLVDHIHLREKERSLEELQLWVTTLLSIGIPKCKLIINTHTQLAAQFGLKGVHLPESYNSVIPIKKEFPQLLVGCSVHSLEAGVKREKEGADYIYYGNVFETSCKPGKAGVGVYNLWELSNSVSIPVIGIGGITPSNVKQVLHTGATGVAIMSPVMNARDPVTIIKKYNTSMREV